MDVTAPIHQLTSEALLESIRRLQLIPDTELAPLLSVFSGADALTLGQELVKKRLLTNFQLERIAEGRASTLSLGNYDLVARLGVGGMGTVYKARHRRMKRVVALKVLQTKLCYDSTFVLRFQREVETIARLGHPNIVMAYDADESDEGHFLVMEFVDGNDLSTLVHRLGVFTVDDSLGFIRQAASGLGYAHQQKIVHRDIKPANLIRNREGVLKVADLGLARLAVDQAYENNDSALTQAGYAMGTPDYMSPEQALNGSDIDGRADIYSLGATLYYLLIGQAMYPGQSPMAVLLQHREAPIPTLRASRPEIPESIEDLFAKMVEKRPEHRFQTMEEVIAAIDAIGHSNVSSRGEGERLSDESLTAPIFCISDSQARQTPADGPTIVLPADAETPCRVATVSVQGLRSLIIEPSRAQASIVTKYLESIGIIETTVVNDAASAKILLDTNDDYQLVVCALHLPDLDGSKLAEQISQTLGENAPCFVLITSELPSSGFAGLTKGPLPFETLLKPFTSEQLKDSILRCLEARALTPRMVERQECELQQVTVSERQSKLKLLEHARVLIVDDSSVARTVERQVLNGLGFRHFVEVEDGAQAIAAATREAFDLIITDYNMPLMDGRALVSYLKQTDAVKHVPIIMVTAEKTLHLELEILGLGAEAVMEKSFPVAEVRSLVKRFFAE